MESKPPIHIHRKRNKYQLTKNGKSYGTYNTLTEVEYIINKMDQENWNKKHLHEYQHQTETYTQQHIYTTKGKNRKYQIIKNSKIYGIFKNFKDATKYRDYLINIDWDIDLDHIRKVEDHYEVYHNRKIYTKTKNLTDAQRKRDLLFKKGYVFIPTDI